MLVLSAVCQECPWRHWSTPKVEDLILEVEKHAQETGHVVRLLGSAQRERTQDVQQDT